MRRKFRSAEDRLWFTADLHFGHHSMVHRCFRPWETVDVMDEALIQNWNACVNDRDHVFVLGDFSFRPNPQTLEILGRLKGIKYLIEGNHDRRFNNAIGTMWDGGMEPYHEITVDDQPIVMCHYAFRSWNKMHYGAWNLHGHSHGSLAPIGKQMDVGVDAVANLSAGSYAPVAYAYVKVVMKNREFVPVDHHTPKENPNGSAD